MKLFAGIYFIEKIVCNVGKFVLFSLRCNATVALMKTKTATNFEFRNNFIIVFKLLQLFIYLHILSKYSLSSTTANCLLVKLPKLIASEFRCSFAQLNFFHWSETFHWIFLPLKIKNIYRFISKYTNTNQFGFIRTNLVIAFHDN